MLKAFKEMLFGNTLSFVQKPTEVPVETAQEVSKPHAPASVQRQETASTTVLAPTRNGRFVKTVENRTLPDLLAQESQGRYTRAEAQRLSDNEILDLLSDIKQPDVDGTLAFIRESKAYANQRIHVEGKRPPKHGFR